MNKRSLQIVLTLIIGSRFIFAGALVLCAQETATQEFTLEEITVTAQKREENQQKVPIAMDVVSGDEIKELGKNDIESILDNISSAIVNKTGTALRVALRGVSNDLPDGTVEVATPSVALNTDGVMSNRQQSGQGLFDIERVEVLYGPQSTLYATATPGGIVNVITAAPKTDKYETSATIEYGSYNYLHTEGAVNVPISETLALRGSFSSSNRDGYLTNGGDDENSKSARLRGLFQPNEKLSFLITAETSKVVSQGFGGVVPFIDQDDRENPWASSSSEAANLSQITEKKIYGSVTWDLGLGTLTVTPSYNESSSPSTSSNEDPFTGIVVTTASNRDSDEKGLEVRMASSDDFFFKWIAGFIWYKSKDISDSNSDDGSFNTMYNLQKIKAAYANITYPVTSRLRATGGARLTEAINYNYEDKYPYADAGGGGTSAAGETYPRSVEMKYDKPDYKFGIEYDLSQDSMLYADTSTSYRTQGSIKDADGHPFPPERLRAYNLGVKNRFLGNRLQINISSYYYKYKNYIALGGTPYLDYKDLDGDGDYDGEGLYDPETETYRNEIITVGDPASIQSGDAREYGLDLATSAIITDNDKVNISVSYMNNKFSHLFFDYLDITNEQGIPDQDYEGKSKTFSPRWTIAATYDHNFALPNGGTVTARIEGKFKTKYDLNWCDRTLAMDANTQSPTVTSLVGYKTQEAFYKADLSAIYTHSDGKWTLTGYVKNLTDYAEKLSYIAMGPMTNMMIGSPRTYGGVLSVKF